MRPDYLYLNLKSLLVCVVAVGLSGCGSSAEPIPELAEVTGMVMLDGEPLEGAVVSFSPDQAAETGSARASTGGTDANGVFKLMYNADYSGAIIGKHTVRISKLGGTPDEPGDEALPPKYNVRSELEETVSGDSMNDFYFDLKS